MQGDSDTVLLLDAGNRNLSFLEDPMSLWRRFGLSLTFAATLAGGVLIAQPAQASTLNAYQCARLGAAIDDRPNSLRSIPTTSSSRTSCGN
jgi:hypothetical protein